MRFDVLLLLGNEEFPVVIEQSIQALENFGPGQVQLVQDQPVPLLDSLHQGTLPEHKLALLIREVVPQVFLDLCVLVVIDPDALVTCYTGHVPDDAGFPRRSRPLQQHRQLGSCNRPQKISEMLQEGFSEMENLWVSHVLVFSLFHQEPVHQNMPSNHSRLS